MATTALSVLPGRSLGKSGGSRYSLTACSECGKERYVPIRKDGTVALLCRECYERKPFIINVLEVKRGQEIGYRGGDKYGRIVCPKCLDERWIRLKRAKETNGMCRRCASSRFQPRGNLSPHWKGGRSIQSDGYVYCFLSSENPYFRMAEPRRSYVLEHRLVMATQLNRCLESWEVVHHINGIRNDNRIDNLQLVTRQTHSHSYENAYRQGFADGSAIKNKELENQIRLLQWHISELTKTLQLKMGVNE